MLPLPTWAITALAVVGFVSVAAFVLRVVRFVSRNFLRSTLSLKQYGAGAGYWAVVTGASDGIGKAYALALAKAGFNVLLVSRTRSKLDAVAAEIAAKYPRVQTNVVAIDFAAARTADFDALDKALRTTSVGVLVNNAGMSLEYPERFLDADAQRQRDIVQVNCAALTECTLRVLRAMIRNAHQGKRGLVLNVSSLSAEVPTPLLAVYSASKSYVMTLSAALAAEYAPRNIDVDCHAPAFVVSAMSKRRRPTWDCPTPEAYVRASLAKAGRADWTSYSPYWSHGLFEFIVRSLPLPTTYLIARNGTMHENIKRAVFRKKAREQAAAEAAASSPGKRSK